VSHLPRERLGDQGAQKFVIHRDVRLGFPPGKVAHLKAHPFLFIDAECAKDVVEILGKDCVTVACESPGLGPAHKLLQFRSGHALRFAHKIEEEGFEFLGLRRRAGGLGAGPFRPRWISKIWRLPSGSGGRASRSLFMRQLSRLLRIGFQAAWRGMGSAGSEDLRKSRWEAAMLAGHNKCYTMVFSYL